MFSRRAFLGMTFGVTSVEWLNGQAAASADKVVLDVLVTDRRGRYVSGLKPSDFRIFEDDIPQNISTVTERQRTDPKSADQEGETPPTMANFEKAYTITYVADPSNHNEGVRVIKVVIITDVDKQWRVSHRPSYRPRRS